MSFIRSLRPGNNHCRCSNTGTANAYTFTTDLQSLKYWTCGSWLSSASCFPSNWANMASWPGLPSHCLHQTSQVLLCMGREQCRMCCSTTVRKGSPDLCRSCWCATEMESCVKKPWQQTWVIAISKPVHEGNSSNREVGYTALGYDDKIWEVQLGQVLTHNLGPSRYRVPGIQLSCYVLFETMVRTIVPLGTYQKCNLHCVGINYEFN